MSGWWERYPEEFEAENSALDSSGWDWNLRESEQQQGRLVIDLTLEHDGEKLKLTAEYPDSYPYFPPEVALKEKYFKRHHNRWSKNLCLLAQEGQDWQPGLDTLASLISSQLPHIFASNDNRADPDLIAKTEDRIGEAFSSFIPCHPESAIIVPDETPSSEQQCGVLIVKTRQLGTGRDSELIVNGAISLVSDMGNRPIAELDLPPQVFAHSVKGFWMRLPGPPEPVSFDDPDQFKRQLLKTFQSAVPQLEPALKKAKPGTLLILGFVYKDEVQWRQNADDWLFVALRIIRQARRSQGMQCQLELVKPDWGGKKAWMQRAPHLKALQKKKVMVVGMGSLGAPLAINLAKAGTSELTIVDRDYLQVGNTIRWPLGWQYAGLLKVRAIGLYIQSNYPYTRVHAHQLNIGVPSKSAQASDLAILRASAESSDIIVDASASFRINHFLSDLAGELDKPYIWLTTTHGAAGGTVGRVVPGKTQGCWHCFQHALGDGSLPLPADSGGPDVQPGGCAQATFIGAGLDSDEVALLASRLTVATLVSKAEGGYPDFEWDVAIGNFWNAERQASLSPQWITEDLNAHKNCKRCNP